MIELYAMSQVPIDQKNLLSLKLSNNFRPKISLASLPLAAQTPDFYGQRLISVISMSKEVEGAYDLMYAS